MAMVTYFLWTGKTPLSEYENAFIVNDEISNFRDNTCHEEIVLDQAVANSEKVTIINALKNFQGHKIKTAAALGISRTTLFNKMKKYQIKTNVRT